MGDWDLVSQCAFSWPSSSSLRDIVVGFGAGVGWGWWPMARQLDAVDKRVTCLPRCIVAIDSIMGIVSEWHNSQLNGQTTHRQSCHQHTHDGHHSPTASTVTCFDDIYRQNQGVNFSLSQVFSGIDVSPLLVRVYSSAGGHFSCQKLPATLMLAMRDHLNPVIPPPSLTLQFTAVSVSDGQVTNIKVNRLS